MFKSEVKECFVFSVVEFRDPDLAAETGAPCVVGLIRDRNSARVVKEAVGVPIRAAQVAIKAAVIAVRSRPHQGIEHAAACAGHFRIVCVRLYLDFLNGFD